MIFSFRRLRLAVLLSIVIACAAGCGHSSRRAKPPRVIQEQTIVLDYRNGWFHEADGFQSIAQIGQYYRRDPQLVAQLNYTTATSIAPKGKLLYIPPSNDRQYVREALKRVEGKPGLVPTTPWSPDLLNQQNRANGHSAEPQKEKEPVVVADSRPVVTAPSTHASQGLFGWVHRGKPADPKPAPAKRTYSNNGKFMWPVEGEVVTRFREGWNKACHGLEISAPDGTPVVATRSGRVLLAKEFPGYGRMILIDHGDGYVSVYGYNAQLLVSEQQTVRGGDRIASVGRPSAGDSGKLFFQIRYKGQLIDPLELLD
ncbi:peptidoglycan DD-metalloendopeptidase family protein [bacterium]|nr:peptidoglycan DD-metalloendopeptidase family protein [bacterium]